MAATKPGTTAKRGSKSTTTPVAAKPAAGKPAAGKPAAAKPPAAKRRRPASAQPKPAPWRARARLAALPPAARLVLLALGVAALVFIAFVVVGVATADDATSSEELPPPDAFDARESSRAQLTTQRIAALCARYDEITDAHGQALALAPAESVTALARLEADVPGDEPPLGAAFAHLRRAIQLDVEAAAWTAAGARDRALAAYGGAEAEALQAEAYALAACEG